MSTKKTDNYDFCQNDLPGIALRFRLIRREMSLTQTGIADESGVSSSFISFIESGKKKPSFELLIFLTSRGFNVNWLITGKGDMRISKEPDLSHKKPISGKRDEYISVPQVTPATAGDSGEITNGEIVAYKYFEKSFLEPFVGPILTTVHGDSMLPVLHNEDLVLVDRNPKHRLSPEKGFIYLVNASDHSEEVAITVKRIAICGTKLVCIPFNVTFDPIEIDLHDRNILGVLLGRVVWFARTLV